MKQTSMNDHAIKKAIKQRAETLIDLARPWFERHGVSPPDPIIRFDLSGLAAGQAVWHQQDRPILRFNLALARANQAAFLSQTVAHEVAHIVTTACFGRTRPHGTEWRSVMAFFGLPNADRCHTFDIKPDQVRRQTRWSYRCDCTTHALSTTRHRRLESGRARYHCRRCGQPLRRLGSDVAPGTAD